MSTAFRSRATGVFALAWLCFVAWMIGRITTDRFATLQFLHWIPNTLALGVTLACGCALIASKDRWMRNTVVVLAIVQSVTLIAQDFAVRRASSESEYIDQPFIRIAHFNANWPGIQALPLAVGIARGTAIAFRGSAPDVLFLSECGSLLGSDVITTYAPPEAVAIRIGRFGIVSRVPILEATPIFDDGASAAALIRFDQWRGNPPWSALLVDLPSDPNTPRLALLERMRARIDGMAPPAAEVVVGDFNTARGGFALHAVAPQLHHAFDEGGVGFGATYPRAWPLWHIDHMLLAPDVCARRYECVDLGVGRHRMQAAIIQFRK